MSFGPSARRVARRKQADADHATSIALMKWLSKQTKSLGIAQHVYIVGGAVRNFVLDQPIKDIDMVVDSLALRGNRDSEWVAQRLAQRIPGSAMPKIHTSNLGVSTIKITGDWLLDGNQMKGKDIDIANAREEEYAVDPATGEYTGHKPIKVSPTTMEIDVSRREFTFNTLMWSLMSVADGPDKAEIIDITGCGLRDLKNREMRCPSDPDETFAQDPTRIIRTIKFAFKYGMKLPPDVKAAAKRQAKGLKRIPSKAWTVLQTIVFDNPQYKKALDVMADLGVTDVLAEMMQSDKQFRSTLGKYSQGRGLAYMFDLMDVGIPVDEPLKFLDADQRKRLREVTTGMDRDDAMAYLEALKNPGKVYDRKFIPTLANSLGYGGKQMRNFMQTVTPLGREALLRDPSLKDNPSALMREVEQAAKRALPTRVAMRWASENEPTDPGLWAKVQALAKGEQKSMTHDGKTIEAPNDGAGFKVFPSAYANGWASKTYGDLGGGWKKKASASRIADAWGPMLREARSQNPYATDFGGSWTIKFDVGRMEPLLWTPSGFKDSRKLDYTRSSRSPKDFRTQAEANREIQTEVLDFIRDYRSDQADLIRGWGSRTARGKAKKDVGHGGLDEWFSGHGGAKGKGEGATWGDWVAISPVTKTLDSGKKVEKGDIVGDCGISDDPDWKEITKGGKDPLKCMPRQKAHDMPKAERAEKAKAKQRAEKADSNRGKKPTMTPTFQKEKGKKKASSDWYYPWDVASGCIWGSGAFKSVEPVETCGVEKSATVQRIQMKREASARLRAAWRGDRG